MSMDNQWLSLAMSQNKHIILLVTISSTAINVNNCTISGFVDETVLPNTS